MEARKKARALRRKISTSNEDMGRVHRFFLRLSVVMQLEMQELCLTKYSNSNIARKFGRKEETRRG